MSGEVTGWEDRGLGKAAVKSISSVIDVDAFRDADDLETVDPED